MSAEFELLKKINRTDCNQQELLKIFDEFGKNRRIRVALAQNPKFPINLAIQIISELFAPELIQVIKNMRANPFVRKQAELQFLMKYNRLLLGEKKSLLRIAPLSILKNLTKEDNPQLLEIIFRSAQCTQELIILFINLHPRKELFYKVLQTTEWIKIREVARAIAHDPQAPVEILLKIIPYLDLTILQQLYNSEETDQLIREAIKNFIADRSLSE